MQWKDVEKAPEYQSASDEDKKFLSENYKKSMVDNFEGKDLLVEIDKATKDLSPEERVKFKYEAYTNKYGKPANIDEEAIRSMMIDPDGLSRKEGQLRKDISQQYKDYDTLQKPEAGWFEGFRQGWSGTMKSMETSRYATEKWDKGWTEEERKNLAKMQKEGETKYQPNEWGADNAGSVFASIYEFGKYQIPAIVSGVFPPITPYVSGAANIAMAKDMYDISRGDLLLEMDRAKVDPEIANTVSKLGAIGQTALEMVGMKIAKNIIPGMKNNQLIKNVTESALARGIKTVGQETAVEVGQGVTSDMTNYISTALHNAVKENKIDQKTAGELRDQVVNTMITTAKQAGIGMGYFVGGNMMVGKALKGIIANPKPTPEESRLLDDLTDTKLPEDPQVEPGLKSVEDVKAEHAKEQKDIEVGEAAPETSAPLKDTDVRSIINDFIKEDETGQASKTIEAAREADLLPEEELNLMEKVVAKRVIAKAETIKKVREKGIKAGRVIKTARMKEKRAKELVKTIKAQTALTVKVTKEAAIEAVKLAKTTKREAIKAVKESVKKAAKLKTIKDAEKKRVAKVIELEKVNAAKKKAKDAKVAAARAIEKVKKAKRDRIKRIKEAEAKVIKRVETELGKFPKRKVMPRESPEIYQIYKAITGKDLSVKAKRQKEFGKYNVQTKEIILSKRLLKGKEVHPSGQAEIEVTFAHEVGHQIAVILGNKNIKTKDGLTPAIADIRKAAKKKLTPAQISENIKLTKKELEEGRNFRTLWRTSLNKFHKNRKALNELTKEQKAYVLSKSEVLADGIGAFILSPEKVKELAPNFYRAIIRNLKSNKSLLKAILPILKTKGVEQKTEARLKNIAVMFGEHVEAKEKKEIKIAKEDQPTFKKVKVFANKVLSNKDAESMQTFKDIAKQYKGKTKVKVDSVINSVTRELESLSYMSGEVSVYMHDLKKDIVKLLEDKKLTPEEIGTILFEQRVSGSKIKQHPLFTTPKTAKADLSNLAKVYGVEKAEAILDVAEKFKDLNAKLIMPYIESGLFGSELIKQIKENSTNYVTWNVTKYFEKKGLVQGKGKDVSSTIFKQVGTFSGIENPFMATVDKNIAIMRASIINKAKRKLVDFLLRTGNATHVASKQRGISKVVTSDMIDAASKGKTGLSVMKVMENGEAEVYLVPKTFVEIFNFDQATPRFIGKLIGSIMKPIKNILVSMNPKWLAFAVPIDFMSTVVKNPEVKLRDMYKLFQAYKDSIKEAKDFVKHDIVSGDIKEMGAGRMLAIQRAMSARDALSTEEELQMIADSIKDSISPGKTEVQKRMMNNAVTRGFKYVGNQIEQLGQIMELTSKLSGYKYLSEHTKLSDTEIAHRVRERIGTPNFKKKGTGAIVMNNMYLFSNIHIRGMLATVEAAKENPAAFFWKVGMADIAPRLIRWAATGAVAAWMISALRGNDDEASDITADMIAWNQRILRGVSEYDKTFYNIVPLGLTESGKSIYLTLPSDYDSRIIGAAVEKSLKGKLFGDRGAISLMAEGIAPYAGMNPLLTIAKDLYSYAISGKPVIDNFTRKEVVGKKAMAKHIYKTFGLETFYKIPKDNESRAWYQELLSSYGLSAFKRYVKVNDRGVSEEIWRGINEVRKMKVNQNKQVTQIVNKLIDKKDLTPEEKKLIITIPSSRILSKVQRTYIKKYGDAYLKGFTSASSKEEKMAVLAIMLQNEVLPKESGEKAENIKKFIGDK